MKKIMAFEAAFVVLMVSEEICRAELGGIRLAFSFAKGYSAKMDHMIKETQLKNQSLV